MALCPTMPARGVRAPASAIPLWRWLLGALVPVYALILTQGSLIAGPRGGFLLWQKWVSTIGLPTIVPLLSVVPALAILVSHLTNQYFLQGVERVSVGRFVWQLLLGIPMLFVQLLFVSAIGFFLFFLIGMFFVFVLMLFVKIFGRPIATSGFAGVYLLIVVVYLACGYVFGALFPAVEPMGRPGSVTDTDDMRRAHRRGGALAAALLVSVPVVGVALLVKWPDVPLVHAIALDEPLVFIGLVITVAWLPHLLLTWRALMAAGPDVKALPLAEFVPRLATIIFVIVALAAVEDVLLGGAGK